ncbi:MAG: cyclic pyranopterin monophosphate synthase MoaC [Pirellulales bacterium]
MSKLTHFDADGGSQMVDVGNKEVTAREARAVGSVEMSAETLRVIREGRATKGDVLEVARLAGIMAAKRTADLIPLCHPLPLDAVNLAFSFPTGGGETDDAAVLAIEATVRVTARTGVEMEALTAVSIAALTVYDMCKSIDRAMTIRTVQLAEKSGGRSGHFVRSSADNPCTAT